MTSWVRNLAQRLRAAAAPIDVRVIDPPAPYEGEPDLVLGRFRRIGVDHYVDEDGRPVFADVFPTSVGDVDRCLAMAQLEASLSPPFAPVIAVGPIGDHAFAIVTPGDGVELFRAHRAAPSMGVAVRIGQQVLFAAEMFEDALALLSERRPLRRAWALVDGARVHRGQLVLRAPLERPSWPLGERLGPKITRIAPEAVRGLPITSACHQFIAALTIVELASSQSAFTGDSEIEIIGRIHDGRVTPSLLERGFAVDVTAVLTRMLAEKPSERYPSLHDARSALEPHAASDDEVAHWIAQAEAGAD